MPLQNRVTPKGTIVVSTARGTMMGNRGNLHNIKKEVVRAFKDKAWKSCLLEFQGIKREVKAEGSYTELFFLDEATAFAAGHRPCNDCQPERVKEFKELWFRANNGFYELTGSNLSDIDEILHGERIDSDRGKVTFTAPVLDLADGVLVELDGKYFLKLRGHLLEWSDSGYVSATRITENMPVQTLTPKSITRCYDNGLIPEIHFSAFNCLPESF